MNAEIQRPSIVAELQSLPSEQLREELVCGLGRMARDLLRLALIVRELEGRGEDLSGLKIGLIHHLRKIACGQLLPEVVIRFAAKPALIALVGNLPLAEQGRLAGGGHVALVVRNPDGTPTHVMLDPLAMTPRQVAQVFARDHLRADSEQVAMMIESREMARKPVPEQVGRLKIDRETQTARAGRYVFTLADLKLAVKLLEGR